MKRTRILRDIMNNGKVNRDEIKQIFGNNYVSFDPIRGNIGYAIYKYESMDWHGFPSVYNGYSGSKYKYGEFEHFDDFIHYFSEMEFIYDKNNYCSGWIYDLPFRLCVDVSGNDM
eukprot:247152_1